MKISIFFCLIICTAANFAPPQLPELHSHSQQQHVSAPPTGHHSDSEADVPDGIDSIETVDVTSSQIILTTSKVGPPESLHVYIDVVEIETGVHLPPLNLTGLLLIITRGRYTINFLKPATWYGVSFFSERIEHDSHHSNFEEKLVKTQPTPEDQAKEEHQVTEEPPLLMTVGRHDDNGKSIENVVVDYKWLWPHDHRKNLHGVANITLICSDQHKSKILKLSDSEAEKTVEVKLENVFEIVESHNDNRQVVANITPKNCHEICWTNSLVAEVENHNFSHEINKECQKLETVTSKTTLRDYLNYNVQKDVLTVHTGYPHHDSASENGIIQIDAFELPHNNSHLSQTFETHNNESDFVIHNLNPSKWYTVQYTYLRKSPFAYVEFRRFLVEPTAANASKGPFTILFLTNDEHAPSKEDHDNHHAKLRPRIVFSLNPEYEDAHIGIDIDPFCETGAANASQHIWLDKNKTKHELTHIDLNRAICGEKHEHPICSSHGKKDDHEKTTVKKCPSTDLCYVGNLMANKDVYSMKKHCINAVSHFPIPANSASTTCRFLHALIILTCVTIAAHSLRIMNIAL